jgi:hypothetical protein
MAFVPLVSIISTIVPVSTKDRSLDVLLKEKISSLSLFSMSGSIYSESIDEIIAK